MEGDAACATWMEGVDGPRAGADAHAYSTSGGAGQRETDLVGVKHLLTEYPRRADGHACRCLRPAAVLANGRCRYGDQHADEARCHREFRELLHSFPSFPSTAWRGPSESTPSIRAPPPPSLG